MSAPRRPFWEDVNDRITSFGVELLEAVPELDAVVVVPSYTIPQDRLSAGRVFGRTQLASPVEAMHVAYQLHTVLQDVQQQALKVTRALESRLAKLTEELNAKTKEIAQIDEHLKRQRLAGEPTAEARESPQNNADTPAG